MGISRTNLVFGLLLMVVAFAILEYGHLLRVYTKSVSFLLLDDAEEISYAFTQPSLSSLPSSSSSSTASRKENAWGLVSWICFRQWVCLWFIH